MKRIKVTEKTKLSDVLSEAERAPIELERDGELYKLARVSLTVAEGDDPFAHYDPEAVRTGMRAAAGSWSDIDPEAFKAYIYRAREEGTRPSDRP